MSRSVTRLVLGVSVPLIAGAILSLLGGHGTMSPAATAEAGQRLVALFGAGGPGQNHFRVLDGQPLVPTPTAVATVASAGGASAEPPATRHTVPPASVPAPKAPAPRRNVSAVGGAAGVQFSLINRDRTANGVSTLSWSAALGRVAQYRAQDMLNRNYFSHYDPSTGQLAFVELLHLWGIPYTMAGENIAWSTDPFMGAINVMFMNSPEHRANILNRGYHRAGVGVASNGYKTIVVEVFSN